MQKRELLNIITNSVVFSHALSDCLNIAIERNVLFQELKRVGKRYEKLVEKNNDRILKGLDSERIELISKEIDQMNEIFSILSKLSFEEKDDILNNIKND